MAKLKERLSRAEQSAYQACLKELCNERIITELPEDAPSRKPLDISVGPPTVNQVFETRSGGSAHYAICPRLVARESGLVITDWQLSNAWDQEIVAESPLGDGPLWNFCGQDFPRKSILNERIEDGLRFHQRDEMIEGWLLGSGLAAIPRELADGVFISCRLTFWDLLGEEIQTEVELSVLRSTPANDAAVRRRFGVKAGACEDSGAEKKAHGRRARNSFV